MRSASFSTKRTEPVDMKILAIRGANLASLTRFTVDLASGPLANTNIFAIVGPTGAGKSTILDALSLALYGRTPRLSGKSGVQIGFHDANRDLRVGAVDPRSIMRRGSGEAFAEVDFVGIDGCRWRTSWSVHRARKRADGAVQQPRVSLTNLDEDRDVSLATNTETLDVVESKTGLSFVQFCRSVLLAQGDFAAFLRATPDERAQLLEQMTGTEVYGTLSRHAHVRAREARDYLVELGRELDLVRVLSESERSDLATGCRTLEERRSTLDTLLASARDALAWHEEAERLAGEVALSESELRTAHEAWSSLGGLRDEVATVERAAPFRATLEELAESRTEAGRARAVEEQAEARLEAAERAVEDAARGVREAEAAFDAARHALDATAPELERARVLDAQLADANEAIAEAEASNLAATTRVKELDAGLEARRAALERAHDDIEEATSWLDAHADVVAFADQWPRWHAELHEYALAHAERVRHANALRSAEVALEAAASRLGARRAELDEVYNEKADATSAIGEAREALDAARARLPAGEAQRRLQEIASKIVALDALASILESTRSTSQQRAAELEQATRDFDIAQRCRQREAEAEARSDELLARLSEAQRDWSRALAEQEMASRRGELLVESEPCPLCGSRVHPWAHVTVPPSDRSSRFESDVNELQRQYDEARTALAAARAEGRTRAESGDRSQTRAGELAEELTRLASAWSERRAHMELDAIHIPETFSEPSARDALFGVRASLVKQREAAAEFEERALQLQQRLDEMRTVYDGTAARIERLTPGFESAREEVSLAQRAKDAHTADLEAARARCLRSRTTLESVLGGLDGWVMEFEDAPEAFVAARAADVSDWKKRTEAIEVAQAQLAALAAQIDGATAEVARAREDEKTCRETCKKRLDRAETLRSDRATIFGGAPRDEVERGLRDAVASTGSTLAGVRSGADTATRSAAEALETTARAREALTAARQRLWAAESKVEAAVVALGVANERSLETLVEKSGDWLAMKTGEIAAVRERLLRLEGLVGDRKRRLAEHAGSRSVVEGQDEVRARVAELESELRSTSEQLGALADRLDRDEENRQHAATLAPRVDEQRRAVDTWSRLDEVIGSADGKKFRRFAQSLTLDALLAQANCHLAELRPRYRIERVPGFEMEMQVVDTDMGDEVRTVASLSGGETFLVSLALALGLSSLAAGQVRIESLFIDEGFGTLDKDTLEVALSVLDQLQAEGRSIGIISHVPDLAERVGYQVFVEPIGPGRSVVRVSGAPVESVPAVVADEAPVRPTARRRAKKDQPGDDAVSALGSSD
jgi:DNA repair protein SbcC/Rad50